MNLKEILEEWKTDVAQIDDVNLDREAFRTPGLHAKYLEQYVEAKANLASQEKKLNTTKYIKKKYFRGELTKTELDKYGWQQYQGLKPSNSELKDMFEMDEDLANIQERIDYYKTAVSALEYIMKQLQSRDYTIKTVFEYRKYLQGG